MKTYFISLRRKTAEYHLQVVAQDIYAVAGLVAAMNFGAGLEFDDLGAHESITLTDLSTSKRRGVDYVNLDVWAQ